jgi:hypothetical protein
MHLNLYKKWGEIDEYKWMHGFINDIWHTEKQHTVSKQ